MVLKREKGEPIGRLWNGLDKGENGFPYLFNNPLSLIVSK